jgi:hypothetical protein
LSRTNGASLHISMIWTLRTRRAGTTFLPTRAEPIQASPCIRSGMNHPHSTSADRGPAPRSCVARKLRSVPAPRAERSRDESPARRLYLGLASERLGQRSSGASATPAWFHCGRRETHPPRSERVRPTSAVTAGVNRRRLKICEHRQSRAGAPAFSIFIIGDSRLYIDGRRMRQIGGVRGR